MSYRYSEKSRQRLATVDPVLALVFEEALKAGLIDIAIIQGRRSKEQQNVYYAAGKSKVQWPNSKHNTETPNELAQAIDAGPVVHGKISWEKDHCIYLAGIVMATAASLGVKIRWGGNWDMDGEPVTDQSFQDLVHYEKI